MHWPLHCQVHRAVCAFLFTNHLTPMLKKIILSALLTYSTLASAQFQSGKISGYIPSDINGKELLLVQINDNISGGCNITGRFAIDSSQLRFKAIRAAVMAAFHNQTPITVAYKQTCNSFGNAWDLDYICISNIPC